jgi:HK97 family phage prohead protease
MAERERRAIAGTVETRGDGAESRALSGYAAVFGQRTSIMGLFDERIAPGAFSVAVARDDVRALFNHDANYVLGRTSAGTLRLSEDAYGLRYDIDVPDTSAGRDVLTLVSRGDVQGSSFAFEVEAEEWDHTAQPPLRTITRVKLYDVGPVTFPAYEQTSVSARCRQEAACASVDTLTRERSRWTLAQK